MFSKPDFCFPVARFRRDGEMLGANSNSEVTAVVVGPRRPKHLEPALRALEHPLSQAEADELAELFA